MDDVILNKKESIERCVKQVREFYATPDRPPFEEDYLRQDAIALNLQRGCEQCIDLANHVIRMRKLGFPKVSRESFTLLGEAGVISRDLVSRMEKMVGLRNLLVHQYEEVDVQVLKKVIETRLDDLLAFVDCIIETEQQRDS